MRVVWTAPAIRDLAEARRFVALDNPDAAARQAGRVVGAVEALIELPERGRPGRWDGTRELVVGGTPYVVPYRVRGEVIEVLRVLHGRRNWPDRP